MSYHCTRGSDCNCEPGDCAELEAHNKGYAQALADVVEWLFSADPDSDFICKAKLDSWQLQKLKEQIEAGDVEKWLETKR